MGKAWILVDDGKVGTEKQCLALAEALNLKPEVKRVQARLPWRWLPSRLWVSPLKALVEPLLPPYPDLVIASGRVAAAPASALKELGAKVIFILDPRLDVRKFDVVIAPEHDQLKGENVITTLGALNNITPEKLQQACQEFAHLKDIGPGPYGAVLIGGNSKHHQWSQQVLEQCALNLQDTANAGAKLWVTMSRRTTPEQASYLRHMLKHKNIWIWDEQSPNPYMGMLALADFIIVTSDSVSMVTEALSTGKPVYSIDLPTTSQKFQYFRNLLEKKGYIRAFKKVSKPWHYQPLQETKYCAELIRQRLKI